MKFHHVLPVLGALLQTTISVAGRGNPDNEEVRGRAGKERGDIGGQRSFDSFLIQDSFIAAKSRSRTADDRSELDFRLQVGCTRRERNNGQESERQCDGSKVAPRFQYDYRRKTGTAKNRVRFALRLEKLVEINDDLNVAITNSSSQVSLREGTWTSFLSTGAVVQSTTADGVSVKTAHSTLAYVNDADKGNLNFTVVASIADGAVNQSDGTTLRPNGVKFSLFLENFPYKWQNSQVVLVCSLFADSRRVGFYRTENSSDDDDPTQVSLDNDQSRLLWKTEVLADGLRKNITLAQRTLSDNVQLEADKSGSTDSDDYQPTFLAFKFPRGAKIAWDPEFFVNEEAANLISNTDVSEGSSKGVSVAYYLVVVLLSCLVAAL